MSSRETKRFRMYDQNMSDLDLFNSVDSEMIEISSPPIQVYEFDVEASLQGKVSGLDELYGESDIINEDELKRVYEEGFGGTFDSEVFRDGEIFKPYKILYGYYIEPTWVNDLTRFGIENIEEELSITFNYDDMMSRFGRSVKISDVIKTFRGKIYRIDDAFIADEVPGWKYIHWRIIGRKPKDLDHLVLPD